MKLSAVKHDLWKPQRVLVFGDSKTGKTELAGKLAEQFTIDWFDLENGHDVLFKLPASSQDRINLYNIPDTRDWPIAIETLRKITKGESGEICILHGKMGCTVCKGAGKPAEHFNLREMFGKDRILVIDSGTQLGNSAMNRIIHDKPEDFKPGWEEYRKQGVMLDAVYSNIQQSWYNVVLICHTTQARMEDETKSKLVPVSGTDNFSRNLAKYFDHVVYCDVGLNRHNFGSSTTYRPSVLTGSRLDVAIEKMDVAKLLPFFDGTVKPRTDEQKAAGVLASAMAQVSVLNKK